MRTSRSRPLARAAAGAFVLSACGILAACGGNGGEAGVAEGPPVVIATTSIWADVTSEVVCGQVEVDTLVPAGADVHEYEPSVRDADLLRGADLIVANGLGLEEGAADAIDAAAADEVTVVEVGPDLDPLEGDGDELDPHVWMDPDRVAAAVPLIAEALSTVDGLGTSPAELDACAQEYLAELGQLSADLDAQLSALAPADRRLVSDHEALGYLADRFDLDVIGAIIPSTSSLGEPNVRDLDELAATMQQEGVTRIYGEVTGSDEVSSALAERVGSDVTVVALYTESLGDAGSGATTYLDLMRTNGDLIAGG